MVKRVLFTATKTAIITLLVFFCMSVGFEMISTQGEESSNKALGLVMICFVPMLLTVGLFIKKNVR